MTKYVTLLLATCLVGCADGSALVIGQKLPEIEDWSTVTILAEMPDGANQIAFVKASSDTAYSQQQKLNDAVEELKKQAAKVGANAVVFDSKSTESATVTSRHRNPNLSGTKHTVVTVIVEGLAVHVEDLPAATGR